MGVTGGNVYRFVISIQSQNSQFQLVLSYQGLRCSAEMANPETRAWQISNVFCVSEGTQRASRISFDFLKLLGKYM